MRLAALYIIVSPFLLLGIVAGFVYSGFGVGTQIASRMIDWLTED